jgi:FKBP-type peptidyl-prolyl cis-trans isomerase SlyD
MRIGKDSVVKVDYILKNDAGQVVEDSGSDALFYLHGHGQIVPGLERALEGKNEGDNVKVKVAPKDGYGEKSSSKKIPLGRDEIPYDEMEVGMPIEATSEDGKNIVLWVHSKNENGVELSLDHPLAGETLHFEVTVREVRKATKEELAHGHVHGPGDHHH